MFIGWGSECQSVSKFDSLLKNLISSCLINTLIDVGTFDICQNLKLCPTNERIHMWYSRLDNLDWYNNKEIEFSVVLSCMSVTIIWTRLISFGVYCND